MQGQLDIYVALPAAPMVKSQLPSRNCITESLMAAARFKGAEQPLSQTSAAGAQNKNNTSSHLTKEKVVIAEVQNGLLPALAQCSCCLGHLRKCSHNKRRHSRAARPVIADS